MSIDPCLGCRTCPFLITHTRTSLKGASHIDELAQRTRNELKKLAKLEYIRHALKFDQTLFRHRSEYVFVRPPQFLLYTLNWDVCRTNWDFAIFSICSAYYVGQFVNV